ncbi:MAG: type II toxin-antitoxin system HicB family antitoxin [Patescibacteria group bacterium]
MLTFKLEKDGDQYHAFCPELKGCHTFGNNPEEALKNLKNAVSLYIETGMLVEQIPVDQKTQKLMDNVVAEWNKV